MSSSGTSDRLCLERDLPTSAQDVVALRRARQHGAVDTASYLLSLGSLPEPAAQVLASRRPFRGDPFELQPCPRQAAAYDTSSTGSE
jgi:hypothetical protein